MNLATFRATNTPVKRTAAAVIPLTTDQTSAWTKAGYDGPGSVCVASYVAMCIDGTTRLPVAPAYVVVEHGQDVTAARSAIARLA